MRPESNARRMLAIASAKAKMWEYGVPPEAHVLVKESPTKLVDLAVGALGDFAAYVNGEPCDKPMRDEAAQTLRFASRFFDTLPATRLAAELDPYATLCASACYYLADMPGSSAVLARPLRPEVLDLGARGLERLLLSLLSGAMSDGHSESALSLTVGCWELLQAMSAFERGATTGDEPIRIADNIRLAAYASGSAAEVLFADAAAAVLRKRVENSVLTCLPRYTDLSAAAWREVVSKPSFMHELWPAQRLLGEHGVLRGRSAVVQMPTSAGKTRATELVMRSGFLSGRASLGVVVAPFRALCHEISRDLQRAFSGEATRVVELSDVVQHDVDVLRLSGRNQILVVTPEKLQFVLRHQPELAPRIGLVLLDEGHLFDDGVRGVNYELLITSIRRALPAGTQILLVSAVISNADEIRQWLLDGSGDVVSGAGLSPTRRSVAFTSWLTSSGRLQFTDPSSPEEVPFFVPRVLTQEALGRKGKERKNRRFPEKDDPKDVALYLGLRLAPNGSVVIYCGRKDTAAGICARVVDCADRGLHAKWPASFGDGAERSALHIQHERNLGAEADLTRSAALGVYAHHGSVPHGIRVAVEYAMQQGHIRLLACTSTLGQGVNMPVRYLIVAGVYQGADRIRVRDFHNLMGRVGRAGIHSEGTLIFADPRIYDSRASYEESWRWHAASELLDQSKSERCTSAMSVLLRPLRADLGWPLLGEPLHWVREYLRSPVAFAMLPHSVSAQHPGFDESSVRAQLEAKVTAIKAIQSFLMAHASEWLMPDGSLALDDLAAATLAFSLADNDGKGTLRRAFHLIAEDLVVRDVGPARRTVFGRTLLGLADCLALEGWVSENLGALRRCDGPEALLLSVWPVLRALVSNANFRSCDSPDRLLSLAKGWTCGVPFSLLFDGLRGARFGRGANPRWCTMNHVVDLCENALGFDGSLLVGAARELVGLIDPEALPLLASLARLQKNLKYGLAHDREVTLHELGFCDRPLAQELAVALRGVEPTRAGITVELRARDSVVREVLRDYPSYFSSQLDLLLTQ